MKVLFASSEIFPYAKSGGLADVAAALPLALSKDIDICSIMPLYGFMDKKKLTKTDIILEINLGGINYTADVYKTKDAKVLTYFIDAPLLSTTKNLYGDSEAYANNDIRFGIFSKAISLLAKLLHVELVHLNDWHCALSAFWLKDSNIKTVFTIHNLAYQGIFKRDSLDRLGINQSHFEMQDLEFYGKCNFMKAGIKYSDRVTTVSPNYAKEILTPKFGCGLEGFLSFHKNKLSGIINGIDTEVFNPKSDDLIFQNYDVNSLNLKIKNKKELYKNLKFKNAKTPLFVMISRLVEQKGFDLILESIDDLLKKELNLIFLVDGVSNYKKTFEDIAKKSDNFEFLFGYDEKLSHLLYASGNFLLMPSKFEPCGLNQLIAMQYGTIPIVHNIGGLKDTVHTDLKKCGQGIVFTKQTKKAFILAINRALKLKNEKNIQIFDMNCDFSFSNSAKKYLKLYKEIP